MRAEELAEVRLDAGGADIRQGLAAEQIAAEVVEDGEGITVLAVAQTELTFEVDGPDLVGGSGRQGRDAGMFPLAATSARLNAAVAGENVGDGAPSGPVPTRILAFEALEDFPRAPATDGMFGEDELDDGIGRLMGAGARGAAVIVKPAGAALAVPLEPFVAGVAANAIPEAEFGHAPVAAGVVLSEMVTFEHGIGLLPGHPFSSHRGREKCHPCARTSVTYVPGLYHQYASQAGRAHLESVLQTSQFG